MSDRSAAERLSLPNAEAIREAAQKISTRKDEDSVGALAWNFVCMFRYLAAALEGCSRPDGCVCGGDTPRVRAGCSHFVPALAAQQTATAGEPSPVLQMAEDAFKRLRDGDSFGAEVSLTGVVLALQQAALSPPVSGEGWRPSREEVDEASETLDRIEAECGAEGGAHALWVLGELAPVRGLVNSLALSPPPVIPELADRLARALAGMLDLFGGYETEENDAAISAMQAYGVDRWSMVADMGQGGLPRDFPPPSPSNPPTPGERQ